MNIDFLLRCGGVAFPLLMLFMSRRGPGELLIPGLTVTTDTRWHNEPYLGALLVCLPSHCVKKKKHWVIVCGCYFCLLFAPFILCASFRGRALRFGGGERKQSLFMFTGRMSVTHLWACSLFNWIRFFLGMQRYPRGLSGLGFEKSSLKIQANALPLHVCF